MSVKVMFIMATENVKMYGNWGFLSIKTKMPMDSAGTGKKPQQQNRIYKGFMAMEYIQWSDLTGAEPHAYQLLIIAILIQKNNYFLCD